MFPFFPGERCPVVINVVILLLKAKLETKALKAKRPGFTDDRYKETAYYVENGEYIVHICRLLLRTFWQLDGFVIGSPLQGPLTRTKNLIVLLGGGQ